MIRLLPTFCIFYLLWMDVNSSAAQNINFKHLTINDGLSQNSVYAIIQDKQGFLWFGTKDGLNRYDGYEFIKYSHDAFDTTSISGNHISALMQDSRGYIWAGTLKDGLNCYHPSLDIFYHIPLGEIDQKIPEYHEIRSIAEDSSGILWIGTWGDGIYAVDIKNTGLEAKQTPPCSSIKITKKELDNTKVFALHVDENDLLWIATEEGLIEYNIARKNYILHEIHTLNPLETKNSINAQINSIYDSQDGILWLGTFSGLVRFNKQNGNYKLFPHRYEMARYGWGKIMQIVEDDEGLLWLATPAELMCFNPQTHAYEYFRNDPYNPNSISYNQITSLLVDNTNIIWIGTDGMGLNIYDHGANRFPVLNREKYEKSRIVGFSIRSVMEDNEGNVWIGAEVLYRWNRKTGELKSYETTSDRPDDFGNTNVWSIIQAKDKALWFATDQGLYRYLPNSGKYKHFKHNPSNPEGLAEKQVCTVYQDRHGNIWAAGDYYISRMTSIEEGRFEHFKYPRGPAINKQARVVIYEDQEDSFWLGTNFGLIRLFPETGTFQRYINNPSNRSTINSNLIKSICPDPLQPDHYLWIGTDGGGLNKFSIRDQTFKHFTTNDGLPNNVVYAILPDKNGDLWLSTNRGLSRFNPISETFRNYDVNDGLQSNEFNTGAYYLNTESGEMFLGGIKGLNYFLPEKIRDNPHKPNVVITKITIQDQHNTENNAIKVIKVIPETSKIVISHHDEFISFEFSALNFSSPLKNQYAYKLENLDRKWIYSGNDRNVTYTNLPPGEYVFHVKAANNDGFWNETGASLELVITPPWWKTALAKALFGIGLFSLLLIVRRYEINRISLKSQLKLEKIEIDTLRNLDQLKSNFFANISHEFRTPLTLILGQINALMENGIESNHKKKLQVANENAKKLLDLINQLLDLSKIESGNVDIKSEVSNIVSFLKNIFYSFESIAFSKHIRLRFESEEDNIPVHFDPDKMEKVFSNLLSNAFKFSNEYGEVQVLVRRNGPDRVEITVKDNGIGIPEESLPKVFDRFYQANNASTRDYQGTGIGLALVKELVHLHKGNINVASSPNKGTEFKVLLPALNTPDLIAINEVDIVYNEEETKVQKDLYINSQDSSPSPSDFPKAKDTIILIVEDNIDVRDFLRENLEDEYVVIEAADGREGTTIAQKELPDLIITDVMMPKVDGYQFCKEIRKDERTGHIPIIMLTARAGIDDKIEGLETGIDDYLTKPFNSKELKIRIKNLINQRAQLKKRFSKSTIIKPSEITTVPIDQSFMKKILEIIESHFEDENFGVDALAEKVNMSVSQLNRKLNALIDQPAGQLIRSLRIQRAADLLKQNAGTISEISYKLAFTDQAYFSRVFKKQFGVTPKEYKDQFSGLNEKQEN